MRQQEATKITVADQTHAVTNWHHCKELPLDKRPHCNSRNICNLDVEHKHTSNGNNTAIKDGHVNWDGAGAEVVGNYLVQLSVSGGHVKNGKTSYCLRHCSELRINTSIIALWRRWSVVL